MPVGFTAILLLIAAFIAGILDSTVGGGGFVLIPFMVFSGTLIQSAIGTSRLVFLIDSLSALIGHARKKNIDYHLALSYSLPAVIGAPVGAYITSKLSGEVVSRIFGVFMLLMLVVIIIKPKFGLFDLRKKSGLMPSFAAGFFSGFMIGLLGGGVGIVIIMLLVLVSGATTLLASGTSQAIVFISNIVAFTAYYQNGLVDLKLGLILGIFALIGAQVGVHIAHKVGSKYLRIMLIALTIFSALKLLL